MITSTIAKKSQFLFDLTLENGTPCYKENQKPLKITIDIQNVLRNFSKICEKCNQMQT